MLDDLNQPASLEDNRYVVSFLISNPSLLADVDTSEMLEIDDLEIDAAIQSLNKDQAYREEYSKDDDHENRRVEAVV